MTIDKIKIEFQDILSKREVELLRLREQRDAREVELKERKARESSKIQLTNQYKQLADTREVWSYSIPYLPSLTLCRSGSLRWYRKLVA